MKPAERIESIRVLDLGGSGNGNSGGMNRILSSIINAGAAMPLLKELVNFSDIDTAKIGSTISDYAKGLTQNNVSDSNTEPDPDPASE